MEATPPRPTSNELEVATLGFDDLCLLFIHPPAHGSEVIPAARNTLDSARIPRASKLLICGLFQKGRVLAQDGDQAEETSQASLRKTHFQRNLEKKEQAHPQPSYRPGMLCDMLSLYSFGVALPCQSLQRYVNAVVLGGARASTATSLPFTCSAQAWLQCERYRPA